MKKICIIGPGLTMGGMERASTTIANFFASKGYKVLYIAIFNHPRFLELDHSVIYSEPEKPFIKLPILKTITRIRREIKAFDPSTVLVYGKFFAALTVLANFRLNYPIYISERSSPLYKWPTHLRIFNRIAFYVKSPTGIIAQTNIAANYQKTYYRRCTRIKVIPNAISTPSISELPARENRLLAVGRLNDYLKGLDRLIRALALMQNRTWKLLIAGGDSEGKELKELAKSLNVLERIEFLGKVKDIWSVYNRCKIFIMPSRSEGFPNALCEAMISGMACISFDFIAGPSDLIIDGQNGLLVKEGDVSLLAQKIDMLIEDEELIKRLGSQAFQLRNKLDENFIGEKVQNFIFNK